MVVPAFQFKLDRGLPVRQKYHGCLECLGGSYSHRNWELEKGDLKEFPVLFGLTWNW